MAEQPVLSPVFKRTRTADAQLRLLLHSALLPDAPAWEAWKQWRSGVDVQSLKDPSISLLPYVFKRWGLRIKDDPVYPIMKGVYRRTWYRNQMLLDQARRVAEAMGSAGIPVLFLKGMAALLSIYSDPGLRAMKDLDVLVPTRDADRAILILESLGFRFRDKFAGFEYVRFYTHGAEYYSENFGKIDLHWNAFHDIRVEEADRLIWRESREADLKGSRVRIPKAEFFLIHTLLAAARFGGAGDMRWMMDAAALIRSVQEPLDWQSIVRFAEDPLKGLPLRDTLAYLNYEVPGLVPAGVLETLAKVKPTAWQARFYEWVLDADLMHGSGVLFRNWTWTWNYYRVICHKASGGRPVGPLRLLSGFIPFLKARYRAGSFKDLAILWFRRLRQNPSRLWQ